MAEKIERVLTDCPTCQQSLVGAPIGNEIVERIRVNVKLNGPNGQWPAQEINAGDTLYAGFGRSAGNLTAIQDNLRITRGARAGYRLVAYAQLFVREEPIPVEG